MALLRRVVQRRHTSGKSTGNTIVVYRCGMFVPPALKPYEPFSVFGRFIFTCSYVDRYLAHIYSMLRR